MEKIKRIIVESVSKKFMIGSIEGAGALARFISLFSGKEPKRLIHVLENLSFNVYSGEVIGIIGDNGSGKSTALRCIAGIYASDSGNIITEGKIISLIGLGAGMKDRLTMRENISLIGSLFGLSQKEIKDRLDSIIKFSELEEFVNTKLYQFSAGMLQRLAFSIAVHSNPDILLLDEVFEVGDEIFKRKSAEKIKQLVISGASVVFVSHELEMIKKYCNRLIWLEGGKLKAMGEADEIIKQYKNY